MTIEPRVVMVGLHHKAAPLEELERVRPHAGTGDLPAVLACGAQGAVAVVTCHRVELYLEGVAGSDAGRLFSVWRGGDEVTAEPLVLSGMAASRHLLRVAAGLEAAVLGDDQILGQLREAYRRACEARCAGPLLHRLFHTAFRTGKRVRSETDLARGGRSVAGEAVCVLGRLLGGLAERRVLVVGAGEIASLAARRLASRGTGHILVTNRSPERAEELACVVRGTSVPWAWRATALQGVDAVIVGTAADEPVLREQDLAAAVKSGGRLVAMDLSMPRNLEPQREHVAGLELIDLAHLTNLLDRERARREAAVQRAARLVEDELGGWLSWAREWRAGRHAVRTHVRAVG